MLGIFALEKKRQQLEAAPLSLGERPPPLPPRHLVPWSPPRENPGARTRPTTHESPRLGSKKNNYTLKAVFRRSHGDRAAGRDGLNYQADGVLGYIKGCLLGMLQRARLDECWEARWAASMPLPA